MNDYYLKNISDKIKTAFQAKAKNGHKVTGAAPYGYMRDPADHTRIIVDRHAAEVVKKIFELRTEGLGYTKIAGILNKDMTPPPRLHYYQRQNREIPLSASHLWTSHSLPRILRDEHYIGTTVSFKSKRSYRSGKSTETSEDEWLRIPDTHEAIIDNVLWEKVQEVNEQLSATVANKRESRPSLFSGKIYCADCKINMTYRVGKKETRKDGSISRYGSYICKSYVVNGKAKCSWHCIYESILKKIVLENIKQQAEAIRLNESAMLQKLREKLIGAYSVDKAALSVQRHELEQELHTIDLTVDQLYEDKINGVITTERFAQIAAKTEIRRREAEEHLTVMAKSEAEAKSKLGDIQKWISLIKEKAVLDDVDRDLLEALIDRVEIGKRTKENGVVTQDVWIYYNFVGLI
jgi:hypothetical protein